MVLKMARPTTRKGTSNVTFRKRIPADVRRILDTLPAVYRPRGWGTEEIVITLGTADRRKASAEYARVAAEVEARIANLRRGMRKLSQREAVALAGLVYRGFAEGAEENPGEPGAWDRALAANIAARRGQFGAGPLMIGDAAKTKVAMEDRFGEMTDALLASEGMIVDAESRALVLRELARALDQAAMKLARNAEGDYRADPAAERFPEWKREKQEARSSGGPSMLELFERWASHPEQKEQSPRTVSRYRGVFAAASEFLNSPAARAVTTDDLQRYIEARLSAPEEPLKPRGARDVHKAALSSVYGWAVAKRLVPRNPAKDVHVKVIKARKLRPEEASDDEVRSIADAALSIAPDTPARTVAAARRWCTLLTLYNGCRIGEITQLRKEDVTQQSGARFLRITPEAGTVKDREFRLVPLHPRLIEAGFLTFVANAPDGPLFYDPARRRRKDAKTPQSELVAGDLSAWSRTVGLDDPRLIRPLHALRHRFMTCARRAGVEEQYVQEIAGHSPGTRNRTYGTFPPGVLYRELCRLSPIMVEGREATRHRDAQVPLQAS
jgi:integrase